jgi:serine/threonine-protein kinase 24/25/MST4
MREGGPSSSKAISETGKLAYPPFERMETSSLHSRYSTVRPVKKLDAAASQRMSTEFIGSGSVRRMPTIPSAAAGPSGTGLDSPMKPRAPLSARGRAGQVLVEEVMLGVLDSVS